MATVSELLQDIAFRLGPEFIQTNGEPFILRGMNRIYRALNVEHLILEKEYQFGSGGDVALSIDSNDVGSAALPSDWVRPFNITPYRRYVAPGILPQTITEARFWIKGGSIYFSTVDSSALFTVDYYSSGLTLVNSAAPSSGQTNTPEWGAPFHDLLLYATALHMAPDYPQRAEDARMYAVLYDRLVAHTNHSRQDVSPALIGEGPRFRAASEVDNSQLSDDGMADPYA